MAYIGNQPAESFTSFATQEFSTSATTSYTLDHAVANENEIALFVNNVRQQPGSGKAYTATGTALTLSAATASTDTMYCVFLGRALQTVTPATNSITAAMVGNDLISGKDALASEPADTDEFLVSDAGTLKRIDYSLIKGGGITEADQWRITSNSADSSGQDITSNWERNDSTAYGKIGTGMSESSGIFTFASTGIYLVIVQAVTQARNGNMNQGEVQLKATTDNSSYSIVSQAETECAQNAVASVSFQALIDVTDTSNVKVKITTSVADGTDMRVLGDTGKNRTGLSFIRIGDT